MKDQRVNIKNVLLVTALGFGIIGTGAYLVKPAAAEDSGSYPTIIQKLVDRFGLNADEVQEVFTEHREEIRAVHQTRFEERLNEAVAEGKITEDQKAAILAKKEEMITECEEMKGFSWEERKETMQQHQEEMKAWAEENGIDLKEFFGLGLGGFRKGHFGPRFGN